MPALADCEALGFFPDTGRLVLGMSVLTSRLQEAQGTRTKELGLQLKQKGSPARRLELKGKSMKGAT